MPFKPGQSGNPGGRPKKSTVDTKTPRAFRSDGWESLINGLGNADYDRRLSVNFGTPCVLSDQKIRDLWRGNWLAKKIIEKLPKNEIRPGFRVVIKDDDSAEGDEQDDDEREDAAPAGGGGMRLAMPLGKPDPRVAAAKEKSAGLREQRANAARDAAERIEQIQNAWKSDELDLNAVLFRARCFQRAYGLGGILLGTEDNQPVDKPLDVARVRKLHALTVLEKQEFAPRYYYSDPFRPKFGKPSHYLINPVSPGEAAPTSAILTRNVMPMQLVHESRLIALAGPTVTNLVQSAWPGAGDSVLQPVYETLRDFGIGWSGAAILLGDFAPAVLQLENLSEMLAADDPEFGEEAFIERMRLHERAASVARVRIIGPNESFTRATVPVAGLAELLAEMKALVAGAADMPITELFGESAKGLNATGEGDRTSWYGEIYAVREETTIPVVTKIVSCQLASTGGIPDSWCVEGGELEKMSPKEQAEIELLEAQADEIRVNGAVVSPEEVAVSRFKDGKRGLTIDFDAREELLSPAPKPVTTEGVDPDLEPPPVLGLKGEPIPAGATIVDPPAKPEQRKPPAR